VAFVKAPAPPDALVDYEPRLVEAAVLAALRGRPEEPTFRAECDLAYALDDPDLRESAFRVLHADWFARLGLAEVVLTSLDAEPTVRRGVDRCLATLARTRRDEGAELFVAAANAEGRARRTLVLSLHPETFADSGGLRALLARELLHVADMLDPAFGYAPGDPAALSLPPALFRARYAVLWRAAVDGRLVRRRRLQPSVRGARLREFTTTFSMLGSGVGAAFERVFDGTVTHADLVRLALHPSVGEGRPPGPHTGERCPLCACPTYDFEPEPERLPEALRARIRASFPAWSPAAGLCWQCADLYGARVVGTAP
jgi:hypothetical protein